MARASRHRLGALLEPGRRCANPVSTRTQPERADGRPDPEGDEIDVRNNPEPIRPDSITPEGWAYAARFGQVSTAYQIWVSAAYDGDRARAMVDDAETVAAKVADLERSKGRKPTDWNELGRSEGHPGQDPGPCNWTEQARASAHRELS